MKLYLRDLEPIKSKELFASLFFNYKVKDNSIAKKTVA